MMLKTFVDIYLFIFIWICTDTDEYRSSILLETILYVIN